MSESGDETRDVTGTIVPPPDPEGPEPESGTESDRSSWARQIKRFGILFWLCVAWLLTVIVASLLAGFLPLRDPVAQDYGALSVLPGEQGYLLGTDRLGRDILSQAMFGARISLTVSVFAVSLGMIVGGGVGMLAGYFRGRTEKVIMAGADAMLAFPPIVLLLAVTASIGASTRTLILALGLLGIPAFARLSRANTLTFVNREFVIAARSLGASNGRILGREILPNILPPVGAYAFLIVASLIVAEGSLSFLGLGIPPPTPTWGRMIAEGRDSLAVSPHITFIPSAVMFLTVLSFNMIGDRLREEVDVKEGN